MRTSIISSVIVLFASLFISSVQAQDWDDDTSTDYSSDIEVSVKLFSKANFEGDAHEVSDLGAYNSEFIQEGIKDKMIVSIQVSKGIIVRLYSEDEFEGKTIDITSDMKMLPKEWIGKVGSLEVLYAEQGGGSDDEGW